MFSRSSEILVCIWRRNQKSKSFVSTKMFELQKLYFYCISIKSCLPSVIFYNSHTRSIHMMKTGSGKDGYWPKAFQEQRRGPSKGNQVQKHSYNVNYLRKVYACILYRDALREKIHNGHPKFKVITACYSSLCVNLKLKPTWQDKAQKLVEKVWCARTTFQSRL